jgi:signal transduction histidine kinase
MHEFQRDIDAINDIQSIPTILDVVRQSTGMRFVAIARVTEGRWIACQTLDDIDFGLTAGGELDVETTICHEIHQSRLPVAIDEVGADERWRTHHTPLKYGFQSYISMPIVLRDGSFFGTICALDPRPAKVENDRTLGMFRLFAELISRNLDVRGDLADTQSRLKTELETAELRDQFVAVLGHDLRNPLASIKAGIRQIQKSADGRTKTVVDLMNASADRMANLIDNVLDFARGQLGGGLGLHIETKDLVPMLDQIVREHRIAWPGRVIRGEFPEPIELAVDHARIGQMFSNLLSNAMTHGDPKGPVIVRAVSTQQGFSLSTANAGEPIPEDAMDQLFRPFKRRGGTNAEGLGLGLYIAAQIAAAHQGRLEVLSTPEETVFTFSLPQGV